MMEDYNLDQEADVPEQEKNENKIKTEEEQVIIFLCSYIKKKFIEICPKPFFRKSKFG